MKKLPRFVFLFFFWASLGLAQTPSTQPAPPTETAPTITPSRGPGTAVVPAIVTNGFDAYAMSGAKAAMDIWFKGSPLEADAAKGNLSAGMSKTEILFGKMQGWDLFKAVGLTPSTKIIYTVLKFEKGPLWVAFYCYRPTPASEWVVYSMGVDSNPNKVVPPNLLGGS